MGTEEEPATTAEIINRAESMDLKDLQKILEKIRTVDAYLSALAAKDISAAPLHPEVTFESPLSPLIQGLDAVRQVFAGFFPAIKGINQCQPRFRGC